MSEEQLKAFIKKFQADASLQEKIKSAKSPEELVDVAKAEGFVISADHFAKGLSDFQALEVSDEELAMASGGDYSPGQKTNTWTEFWIEASKDWFKK